MTKPVTGVILGDHAVVMGVILGGHEDRGWWSPPLWSVVVVVMARGHRGLWLVVIGGRGWRYPHVQLSPP